MNVLKVDRLTLAAGNSVIVREVSFGVKENETLGLVGESGSGKTMIALAIMGFLPIGIRPVEGSVWFEGCDLLALLEGLRARYRGALTMIFQEPRAALNPLVTVGSQIARARRLHMSQRKKDSLAAVLDLLHRVGIRDAARVAASYPHQLSGGMCQRVLIAMMLACRPRVLIADEPTTALDVTVQAQIFDLLDSVRGETNASVLLITHDLGVVAQTCDRVVVLYGGQVMEISSTEQLFRERIHPYTRYLIESLEPTTDEQKAEAVSYELPGCRFAHRCPEVDERCFREVPKPVEPAPGSVVFCHRREEELAARG